jgi:hypothetical protein
MRIIEPWTKRGNKEFPEFIANVLNAREGQLAEMLAGIPAPMPGFADAPQEIRKAAGKTFAKTLRNLVDQWLASGRQGTVEEPLSRSADWRSEEYPKPIIETLSKFRDANPPIILLNNDGQFEIVPMGPVRYSTWASMVSGSIDPQQHAKDHAIALFVKLLESECPQRIFRCDNCGRYSVRERKPRGIIKNGAYCKDCKPAGRVRAIEEKRKAQTNEMLNAAAEVWAQWNYSRRNPDQREWVAKQVSERCKHLDPIKRNWVSRNLTRILELAEGKNHA